MSYNFTVYEKTNTGKQYYAIISSRIVRLLDAVLSGYDDAESTGYEYTYPSSGELRQEVTAVLNNENPSYLKLLAKITAIVTEHIRHNDALLNLPTLAPDAASFWEGIIVKYQASPSDYTVEDLLAAEKHMADIHDMLGKVKFTIDYHDQYQFWLLFQEIQKLRHSYTIDPDFVNRSKFELN